MIAAASHTAPCLTLPLELWQEIFGQTHTLRDAIAWQHATGVRATPADYKRLLSRRAPSVLLAVPKPQACTLWPGAKGPAPQRPPAQTDFRPLCSPVFFAPKRFAPTAQALTQLFDAAIFMHAFARTSPVTQQLVEFASTAWHANLLKMQPLRASGLHMRDDATTRLFMKCLREPSLGARNQRPLSLL